jgi:hypothetical protein
VGGGGRGVSFFFFQFAFGVESGLSTFYASFFSIKKNKIRVGVKAKSSQVPDMFPIAC